MIDLFGSRDNSHTHCDGVSRRDFLKVGGMAAGGLSLGQLLEVEAAQKTGRSHKAVINIYLPGGPSHLDFFDLKTKNQCVIALLLLFSSRSGKILGNVVRV